MSGGSRSPAGLVSAILAALALRGANVVPRRPDGAPGSGPPRAHSEGQGQTGPGHETRDVNVRTTAYVMGGLAVSAVTVIGGMVFLMHLFVTHQEAALPTLTPQQTTQLVPPAPNLQPNPYADLDRQREGAEKALAGYGYADAARSRAHIPIDRAMQLAVGRSLDGGAPR